MSSCACARIVVTSSFPFFFLFFFSFFLSYEPCLMYKIYTLEVAKTTVDREGFWFKVLVARYGVDSGRLEVGGRNVSSW